MPNQLMTYADLGLTYEKVEGVDIDHLQPAAIHAVMLTGLAIQKISGKTPVLTSGWRDISGQLRAMENMKATQPELYQQVYGPMMKRGQDPATMPHPEGRAGDWRFKGYEDAENTLLEINTWLMEGISDIIGYMPSRIIYPEKSGGIVRCYHVQVPRSIPDKSKFKNYLSATFCRA